VCLTGSCLSTLITRFCTLSNSTFIAVSAKAIPRGHETIMKGTTITEVKSLQRPSYGFELTFIYIYTARYSSWNSTQEVPSIRCGLHRKRGPEQFFVPVRTLLSNCHLITIHGYNDPLLQAANDSSIEEWCLLGCYAVWLL
jgi:hypothetical protein